MIQVRVVFNDGVVSDGSYENYEEVAAYIMEHSSNITTMEVDIEGSDNNRPAFWCEK